MGLGEASTGRRICQSTDSRNHPEEESFLLDVWIDQRDQSLLKDSVFDFLKISNYVRRIDAWIGEKTDGRTIWFMLSKSFLVFMLIILKAATKS